MNLVICLIKDSFIIKTEQKRWRSLIIEDWRSYTSHILGVQTRRSRRFLIMEDDASATDQIHCLWPHIGPVQVMVCLLSSAEEVFKSKAFGMLMLIFYSKISFSLSLILKITNSLFSTIRLDRNDERMSTRIFCYCTLFSPQHLIIATHILSPIAAHLAAATK